jgi:HlyD family secretion protein
MTANVTVLIDQREGILKVPTAALRFRPPVQDEKPSSDQGATAGMRGGRPAPTGPPSTTAGSFKQDTPPVGKKNRPTLWTLSPAGKPEPTPVQTGISDGSSIEIVSGELKEGDMVIVGMGNSNSPQGNQQVNPFAPQFGRRR